MTQRLQIMMIMFDITGGANVHFNNIINETKDEFIDFLLSRETSYLAMKNSRDGLEEKIKNSGGLTK